MHYELKIGDPDLDSHLGPGLELCKPEIIFFLCMLFQSFSFIRL